MMLHCLMQAQEGLVVVLEDTDLLLLDGDTYASILKTGARMCTDDVCTKVHGLLAFNFWVWISRAATQGLSSLHY
jgi:hypothetical protein